MTPTREKHEILPNSKFLEAEKMINKAIADMDDETHIEYDSAKIYKVGPERWKTVLHRLMRIKH